MAPCKAPSLLTPQSWSSPSPSPTIAHYNGTLQWHPAMAPSLLTPPKLVVTLPFPHDSTLQWHPAMAPRPLPQSSWSPHIAHYNGTLQWHHAHYPKVALHPPAHYNGTLQWHHVLLQSWPSPSPAPTIAHYNDTLQWHHVLLQSWPLPSPAPTIQWHRVHSPKVRGHPPPEP